MKTKKPVNPFLFNSMKAASGALKVPYSSIQALKASGTVPGFGRDGRVDLREVMRHLLTTDPEVAAPAGFASWKEVLLRSTALRSEVKLMRERDELINAANFKAALFRCGSDLKSLMFQQIAEVPPRLAAAGAGGGDIAQCRGIFRDVVWAHLKSIAETLKVPIEAANELDRQETAALASAPIST